MIPDVCPSCFASHGCDLEYGHEGDHWCLHDKAIGAPGTFSWHQAAEYAFDVFPGGYITIEDWRAHGSPQ